MITFISEFFEAIFKSNTVAKNEAINKSGTPLPHVSSHPFYDDKCQVRVDGNGVLFLCRPDGVKLPHQIGCVLSNTADDINVAIVSLHVKISIERPIDWKEVQHAS